MKEENKQSSLVEHYESKIGAYKDAIAALNPKIDLLDIIKETVGVKYVCKTGEYEIRHYIGKEGWTMQQMEDLGFVYIEATVCGIDNEAMAKDFIQYAIQDYIKAL